MSTVGGSPPGSVAEHTITFVVISERTLLDARCLPGSVKTPLPEDREKRSDGLVEDSSSALHLTGIFTLYGDLILNNFESLQH